jgi:hypothetical protein
MVARLLIDPRESREYVHYSFDEFSSELRKQLDQQEHVPRINGITDLTESFSGDIHVDTVFWTQEMRHVHHGMTDTVFIFKRTPMNQKTFVQISWQFHLSDFGLPADQDINVPVYGCMVIFNTRAQMIRVGKLEYAVKNTLKFLMDLPPVEIACNNIDIPCFTSTSITTRLKKLVKVDCQDFSNKDLSIQNLLKKIRKNKGKAKSTLLYIQLTSTNQKQFLTLQATCILRMQGCGIVTGKINMMLEGIANWIAFYDGNLFLSDSKDLYDEDAVLFELTGIIDGTLTPDFVGM